MAISYTPVAVKGKVLEEVVTEILFENKTISEELVDLQDNVKADTIVTDFGLTVAQQAYTSGAKTASGTIGINDKSITPVKVMYYDEFDPESLRLSRFKRDMPQGAANITSNEFNQLLIAGLEPKISADAESKFWNGATAATKVAVAALTPGAGQGSAGAAEQTYVAAAPTTLFDGVVTTMIYNSPNAATAAGVGARIKVAGTTISGSNIATEYAKVYAAIPAVVLNQVDKKPYLYAPHSHKQFINILNTSETYRDKFLVVGLGTPAEKYFYNGTEIKFVPLPENCVIAALPENIKWLCDAFSDLNEMLINVIANNRQDMFYMFTMTQFAWVVRQAINVLYLG
jgi:hypothetical protein